MNILFPLAVAVAILVLVYVGVYVYERKFARAKKTAAHQEARQIEGAQRSIYLVFYLLSLWAALVFMLPMLMTFKSELAQNLELGKRLFIFAKVAFLPCVILLLIYFGRKHDYLNWIRELYWPRDEDK
jgi:hypothetical protein